GVRADRVNLRGARPGVIERRTDRARALVAVRSRFRVMMRVVRRAVTSDLSVHLHAALLRALGALQQENRPALTRHVAVGAPVERAVGGGRIGLAAQEAGPHLAGERVRSDGSLEAAADDRVDAAVVRAPRVLEGRLAELV